MLKVISITILGLFLTLSGFSLAYFYLTGVDEGRTPFLLVPGIALIVVGFSLLFHAGKSDVTVVTKPKDNKPLVYDDFTEKKGNSKTLQKNNELVSQWRKTMDQRDRLKLLELSGQTDDN